MRRRAYNSILVSLEAMWPGDFLQGKFVCPSELRLTRLKLTEKSLKVRNMLNEKYFSTNEKVENLSFFENFMKFFKVSENIKKSEPG